MTAAVLDQALFDAAVNAIPADVLSGLRKSAANKFRESGFPTTRHENWRYTNLARAVAVSNSWLTDTNILLYDSTKQADAICSGIDAHWIPIRNGQLELDVVDLPDGVSAARLSDDRPVTRVDDVALDDPMAQLNASLLADGLVISVAPDAAIDKPIGLLFDDRATERAVSAQARVLVDIQEGATARFIEAHVSSGDGEHFANSVIQIDLSRNATADYVRIQQRARHHIQTSRLTADLAENAEFRHCALDFGGLLVRNDIVARLHGRESSVSLNGLYLAGDNQHIDNHTRVDHLVGPARSSEEYRGILNGRSRCVFNGKAIVHAGADGTDARQSNHNLLLSGEAEIDTKPELEIYADEVKCSHGATVGQLDDAALFYLRSRGLDKSEATQLITRAFASKILSQIPVQAANDYVGCVIVARLDSLIGDARNE